MAPVEDLPEFRYMYVAINPDGYMWAVAGAASSEGARAEFLEEQGTIFLGPFTYKLLDFNLIDAKRKALEDAKHLIRRLDEMGPTVR